MMSVPFAAKDGIRSAAPFRGWAGCVVFAALLLAPSSLAAIDQGVFWLGVGPEANFNAPRGVAPGGRVSYHMSITRYMAAGANINVSYALFPADLVPEEFGTLVLEPVALFRYYMYEFRERMDTPVVFGQIEIGVSAILLKDGWHLNLDGGGAVGVHIPMADMYFEFYARTGYPYMLGAGVILGASFMP